MTESAGSHRWSFARSGGFDQAQIRTSADLRALAQLDKKLWAALACPVKGLELDEKTLSLIDTDGDSRIRVPEVLAAVKWADSHLKDVGSIIAGDAALPLDRISDANDSARAVLASARQILKDLGKGDATSIGLDDVQDTARIFAQTRFNGDGVVPADAAEDDATKQVLSEAIDCMGAVTDRSGKPGIDQAKLDAFFEQAAAYSAWQAGGVGDENLRPLGDDTAAAADAWRAVRAKVDDFFARCRLAEFDERALAALNRREEEYLAVAAQDLNIDASEAAGFPLARVSACADLPLVRGVNPAWAGAIAKFRESAANRLLGREVDRLTAAEWTQIGAKLAAYESWVASRPATSVEKLGAPRLKEIVAGDAKAAITALIEEDKKLEPTAKAIADVERLVRYHRDLYRLLLNFVNFSDFYARERRATFQAGTLFLDGRACELVVRVADAGKHAALAGYSKAYLAYCDCTRPSGEKMSIAAAFTGGDSDYLMVGRNGVFYDRAGRDWDATITKIVDNPISIRQAFWSPYKKLVRLIEDQVMKRAAAAEAESDARMAATATDVAHADKANAPPPPPKKVDVGTVAALGVALGAIGTMVVGIFGHLTGLFDKLWFWQWCLIFVAVMLLISGPSMLIAWLRLRQRNLGPILDANAWAVNGRVKLNVRFGASLTSVAALPRGAAAAEAADPYADKPSVWPRLFLVAVVLGFLWTFCDSHGWIHDWSGGRVGWSRAELDARAHAEAAPETKDADANAAGRTEQK